MRLFIALAALRATSGLRAAARRLGPLRFAAAPRAAGGGRRPRAAARRRLVPLRAAAEPCAGDDWATAELSARCAPMAPSADLAPEQVLAGVFRGLQFVDVPSENAGLVRAYRFLELSARVAVAGVGRQVENRGEATFVARGHLSPLLQPFIGAARIDFEPLTRIAGTQTRGEIATATARVTASPLTATRHPSGIPRAVALDDGALPVHTFSLRLQKQRRPPLSGAWLVTDVARFRPQ